MKHRYYLASSILVLTVSCVTSSLNSQEKEHISSRYLMHPHKIIEEFMQPLAEFWSMAKDEEGGGFYSFIDEDGKLTGNTHKPFNSQSRIAYGFVKTFMVTGDTRYLELAEHALNFLYSHGWDQRNEGWFFSADRFGKIDQIPNEWSPNDQKWSFLQHYSLLGPLAMVEATHDSKHVNWFKRGRKSLEDHFWDNRSTMTGYYNWNSLDMNEPSGKGFTPTVDAITTHALNEFLIFQDDDARKRLNQLAKNTLRILKSRENESVKIGFAEEYNKDWEIDFSQTESSVGHALKVSWCLARINVLIPNHEYTEKAFEIVDHMIEIDGLDKNLVPNSGFHWNTESIDRLKDFWMLEQAVLAGLTNFHIQKNAQERKLALKMADSSLRFFFDHLVEYDVSSNTFLGVNGVADENGTPVDRRKGHQWKTFYHAQEMAYFTYLYASLFLKQIPIELFYYFDFKNDRTITLTPIAYDKTKYHLQIESVTLKNKHYDNYDGIRRTIRVESTKKGIFKVRFKLVEIL